MLYWLNQSGTPIFVLTAFNFIDPLVQSDQWFLIGVIFDPHPHPRTFGTKVWSHKMTLSSTNKEDRKKTKLSLILSNRDKTNQNINQTSFWTMNSAGLILMATTILLFKHSSGTTLLTFDTEVHSQEKTLSSCSFLYCSLLFTLNKKDSVLWQIEQSTQSEICVHFFP